MNFSRNLAIVTLALLAVGSATIAWRQHRELVELRAGALNQNERADLQKRLWNAEKHAKELTDQLAEQRGKANGESGAIASDSDAPEGAIRRGRRGPGQPGGPGGGPAGLTNLMNVMEKPEMQRLLALQHKGQLDSRYAGLFRKLGLAPEQLDQLKGLMVEKQAAMQDVIAAARARGIDPLANPDGLRTMIADTQAEVENHIKSLLGESSYAQYQDYQQTIPQRNVVNQLQQSLSYTNAPLTETQAEQLVQILARTSPQNPETENFSGPTPQMNVAVSIGSETGVATLGGGGRGTFTVGGPIMGFGGSGTPITDEAITLAQSVLAPQQVQGLQQLQQQQQAQQQLQQTLRQSFGRGPGSPGK